MRKLCWGAGSALLVLIVAAAPPAFAEVLLTKQPAFIEKQVGLLDNLNFETGDFTGWQVNYVAAPDWTWNPPTGPPVPVRVWDGILEGLLPGDTGGGDGTEDAVVVPVGWGTDPYTGTGNVSKVYGDGGLYSARIGDAGNQIFHRYPGEPRRDDDAFSVSLFRQGILDQPLDAIRVSWAAAVVEPKNWEEHIGQGFPQFGIQVIDETAGTVLWDIWHNSHELGAWWTQSEVKQGDLSDPNNIVEPTRDATEGFWWYRDWEDELIDMRGVPVGHEVSIRLTVTDCGLRGHPAYARLDIGYIPLTDGLVPEPGTILLLAGGLAAAAWRVRRRLV